MYKGVFPLIDSFLGQSTRPFIPSGAPQPMGIFRSENGKNRFGGPFGQAVLTFTSACLPPSRSS